LDMEKENGFYNQFQYLDLNTWKLQCRI